MIKELALGVAPSDVALLLCREVLGIFFVLARFRWFFDPSDEGKNHPEYATGRQHWFPSWRVAHLNWKLCYCGYSRHPLMSAFVAHVEVLGGCALIIGLLTTLAALGLLSVLAFATYCTAREKVMEQHPVDSIDVVSAYLWRVEGVYIIIGLAVYLCGPGRYSLDYLIW